MYEYKIHKCIEPKEKRRYAKSFLSEALCSVDGRWSHRVTFVSDDNNKVNCKRCIKIMKKKNRNE